jgi:hypothetical protein
MLIKIEITKRMTLFKSPSYKWNKQYSFHCLKKIVYFWKVILTIDLVSFNKIIVSEVKLIDFIRIIND